MASPRKRRGAPDLLDPFLPFVKSGMVPGLSRIRRLLALLHHPERSFHSVLITGSNGKGTTSAVLASCLEGFGDKTGLFTSPHLVSVRERFRVNGVAAPKAALDRFIRRHAADCRRAGATYFEATTAFALWWFREQRVKWAVLEIGLGGRFDACNAVDPELSVVTSIALEHTRWLGTTQAAIAAEKGGVARRGKPTLTGPLSRSAQRSLSRTVQSKGGVLVSAGVDFSWKTKTLSAHGSTFTLDCLGEQLTLKTRIPGSKAVLNSALAAAAALYLAREGGTGQLPKKVGPILRASVARARWPARLQVVSTKPFVVLDVAHNEASCAALAEDWRRLWPQMQPVILVGLLDDKPARKIGKLLSTISHRVVVTLPDSERAKDPFRVAALWRPYFQELKVEVTRETAFMAVRRLAGRSGSVLVTGSHFVVGPIQSILARECLAPSPESRLWN